MIEEVTDLWHGSDDFVSFRGQAARLRISPRACEISVAGQPFFNSPFFLPRIAARQNYRRPRKDRLLIILAALKIISLGRD